MKVFHSRLSNSSISLHCRRLCSRVYSDCMCVCVQSQSLVCSAQESITLPPDAGRSLPWFVFILSLLPFWKQSSFSWAGSCNTHHSNQPHTHTWRHGTELRPGEVGQMVRVLAIDWPAEAWHKDTHQLVSFQPVRRSVWRIGQPSEGMRGNTEPENEQNSSCAVAYSLPSASSHPDSFTLSFSAPPSVFLHSHGGCVCVCTVVTSCPDCLIKLCPVSHTHTHLQLCVVEPVQLGLLPLQVWLPAGGTWITEEITSVYHLFVSLFSLSSLITT